MAVIKNTWVEKERKRRTHETAPAYESDPLSEYKHFNAKNPAKRYTQALRTAAVRTLRGVRK